MTQLNVIQINHFLSFRRSVRRFLRVVKSFEIEDKKKEAWARSIVDLRKEIVEIRNRSIIFHDFVKELAEELGDKKTEVYTGKKAGLNADKKNVIDLDMRKKMEARSNNELLKNNSFKLILFHLAEIYADYYKYERILDDILSKKDNIHPNLLHTYLARDFHMMNWHTLDHVDDLVSFEDNELIYVKGLMSSISDFLEKVRL